MSWIEKAENFITSVENSRLPYIYFLTTFFFAILLRNFFDSICDTTLSLPTKFSINFHRVDPVDLTGNTFWYISLALMILIALHLLTRENIVKVSKLVFPGFLILLVVPLVDLLLSNGKGFNQSYWIPGYHDYLSKAWLHYSGPLWQLVGLILRWLTGGGPYGEISGGATPGMRTEVALVLIGIGIYVYVKRRSASKAILSAFIIYSIIFWWGALPTYGGKLFADLLGIKVEVAPFAGTPMPITILRFLLIPTTIVGALTLYFYNKTYFKELIKDLRPFRTAHYALMLVLGIATATNLWGKSIPLTEKNIFILIYTPLAFLFAGIFSIITNNLSDYEIDKVDHPNRPHVTGIIEEKHYKLLAGLSFVLAILYSAVLDFVVLYLTLLFIANYFIYSVPPLRLKRIPFFSKFFLALNALLLVILGYYLVTGETDLPWQVVLFIIISFTACINFIDIKNYSGDEKAGIKTLPVLLGLKKSKILIGAFFLVSYTTLGILIRNLLIPSILFGVLIFLLINKKKYNEKLVFAAYLLSLLLFILYLFNSPSIIPTFHP